MFVPYICETSAYELGWDPEHRQLLVGILPEALELGSEIVLKFSRFLFESEGNGLGLSEWIDHSQDGWGLGGVLKKHKGESSMLLPAYSFQLERIDWESKASIARLYNFSGTLSILTRTVGMLNSNHPFDSGVPAIVHLSEVKTAAQMGYGFVLEGGVLEPIRRIINREGAAEVGYRELVQPSIAMQDAWEELTGKVVPRAPYHDAVGVFIEDDRLHLHCPTDRCDLYMPPNQSWKIRPAYYPLECHNIDNVFQQLTFIAGLGALSDTIRTEGQPGLS